MEVGGLSPPPLVKIFFNLRGAEPPFKISTETKITFAQQFFASLSRSGIIVPSNYHFKTYFYPILERRQTSNFNSFIFSDSGYGFERIISAGMTI